MPTHKLLLLPGDGIGPEVMAEVKRLIDWLNAQGIALSDVRTALANANSNRPKGLVESADRVWWIYAND